jgi:hypothetical protein
MREANHARYDVAVLGAGLAARLPLISCRTPVAKWCWSRRARVWAGACTPLSTGLNSSMPSWDPNLSIRTMSGCWATRISSGFLCGGVRSSGASARCACVGGLRGRRGTDSGRGHWSKPTFCLASRPLGRRQGTLWRLSCAVLSGSPRWISSPCAILPSSWVSGRLRRPISSATAAIWRLPNQRRSPCSA